MPGRGTGESRSVSVVGMTTFAELLSEVMPRQCSHQLRENVPVPHSQSSQEGERGVRFHLTFSLICSKSNG